MDIILYSDRDSSIHRLDPRARLLAAMGLTLYFSQSRDLRVLVAGLSLALFGLFLARVPLAATLQRLVPLNVLLILLAATLLVTTPGKALFQIAAVMATWDGLLHGMLILLKGNTIVALLASLVGSIEFVALARALGQLRVPDKLVNILLLTVRYLNLMLAEYERLSQAALLRGYRPGLNLHTLSTTGNLVGMILVRSHDRGIRMIRAMKLRGYDGKLPWTIATPFQRRDYLFLAGTALTVALLGGVEYG